MPLSFALMIAHTCALSFAPILTPTYESSRRFILLTTLALYRESTQATITRSIIVRDNNSVPNACETRERRGESGSDHPEENTNP